MVDLYPMPSTNQTVYSLNNYFSYITQDAIAPLFFPLILFAIWIITFVSTKSYSSSRAWTFASFLTFILSLPLAIMGWCAPRYCYLTLVLLAIGIAWIRLGDSNG
jgi:hypothetical protein